MILPYANEIEQEVAFVQSFKGYNHNIRTEAGEFYDMKNMCLDHFPVISTRQGEDTKMALYGNPNGLWEYEPDTLMSVSGNLLRVGITKTSPGTIVADSAQYLTDSEKSFATIGQYTVIAPDKVIYDASTGKLSNIVRSYTSGTYGEQYLLMQIIPCRFEGTPIEYVESAEAPADTSVYWYDTENGVYKQYASTTEQWVQIETPYVKLVPIISASEESYVAPDVLDEGAVAAKKEISEYFTTFSQLDTMTYSTDGEKFTDYVVFNTGQEEDETNFVVLSMVATESLTGFTVRTRCPDLDHLVSLNNRVWGVSNSTHEIFACKQGDPTQWYNFAGIASDSYFVSLGFADEVTASAVYNNYVHFFTEDKIIKIYGDYPSNYQLHTTKADGVISGGHDSLVTVEGILFYVSPIGVVSYDGSLPYFRGQNFSPNYLNGKTVVAGRDGTKYCLSVSENGKSLGVFVYDTKYGLWSVGGDQIFRKTAELGNALCFVNEQSCLVTLMDREKNQDEEITVGENIFSLEGREEATF